jgi:hypothetical protein
MTELQGTRDCFGSEYLHGSIRLKGMERGLAGCFQKRLNVRFTYNEAYGKVSFECPGVRQVEGNKFCGIGTAPCCWEELVNGRTIQNPNGGDINDLRVVIHKSGLLEVEADYVAKK